MKIKGFIFDMDGVIADSEPISCYAWNILFEKYFQIDIGRDYSDILGKSSAYTIELYTKKYGISLEKHGLTKERLIKEKDEVFFTLAKKELKPVKGVREFLQFLVKKQIKLALASSGTHRKIDFTLKKLELKTFFPIRVSAEDVPHGKPAPDVFLKAMKKMQVKPDETVIIEDTLSGLQAAKASNAYVIALATTFPRELLQEKADYVASSYQEIQEYAEKELI